jgi:uncharacterized protein
MVWDCTAGKFVWTYQVDETIHFLEGSVTITVNGKTRKLGAGDIAFFPAGTAAFWDVETYVRKIAFCQKPMPKMFGMPLRLARRAVTQLRKCLALVQGSLAEPLPHAGTARQAVDQRLLPSRVRARL